jgi:type I restriction enzyme M protein
MGSFCLISPDRWLFAHHGDVADAKRRAADYLRVTGTYDGAEREIEEFVRQWALAQLLAAYGYPKEWIGERIIIEEPVKMGSSEKEADISIKNTTRRTFLYIETKKRGVSNEEFIEAERQLETYLASTNTATIGMITDGDRVKTLRLILMNSSISPTYPPLGSKVVFGPSSSGSCRWASTLRVAVPVCVS